MRNNNQKNNFNDLEFWGSARDIIDKKNQRRFIEGQIRDAKLSKRLIILNTIIAFLALVVSIISLFK
ncbi:hypothetical protein [Prevotella sp. HCN-7019]|uniref:hypothetical protein n=1 Tax=Prevotella sp. HCN-7019 TaxID=3134668 RepID=UPI0030BB9FBD